jgi:hypothetical protein
MGVLDVGVTHRYTQKVASTIEHSVVKSFIME